MTTREQLEEFYQNEELTEKVASALSEWLEGHNYDKAVKYGKMLDKLASQIPDKFKKSPTNTLYRLVMVKKAFFEKIKKGAPLILRNRKYSSWSYNLKSTMYVKDLTEKLAKDYVMVVLQRKFSDNQILINVAPLVDFLSDYFIDNWTTLDMVKAEKEIIVKNSSDDFKFKPEEIYAYKLEPDGTWYEGLH